MSSPGTPHAAPALEMNRWFAAGVDDVFEAFTNPQLLRQWWGPRGFTIEELSFPAVEGESYRVCLRAPDGSRYVHVGRFHEVLRPMRLSYSWRWVEEPLQREETLVELSFRPENAGTRVELRHSRFADLESLEAHRGWPDSFERFEAWLAGSRDGSENP